MEKTILIADDDRVLVHALKQFLVESGYRVVSAYDGAQALELVQKEHPDLILLDVQMPRIHGYTFLFELRKIDGEQNIPVIVLTSYADMGDMFKAEGVKEFLVKPCTPQTVLDKVKQYI